MCGALKMLFFGFKLTNPKVGGYAYPPLQMLNFY